MNSSFLYENDINLCKRYHFKVIFFCIITSERILNTKKGQRNSLAYTTCGNVWKLA
jgi:hypothetical protein